MEEITNKNGVPAVAVVGITILAAIIFGAGAYMYANNQATGEKDALNAQIVTLQNEVLSAKKASTTANSSTTTTNTDKNVTSTETSLVPSDWKTYKNQKKLGYQFQYPSDLTASDEGKSDPAYPYDIEMSNEEYSIIGMTSELYDTTADGSVSSNNKENTLKSFAADSMYKKISIAGGGEGYYNTEGLPGGGISWTVYFIGDKGMATMYYHTGNLSESEAEKLLRQIVGTFKFNQ